MAPVNVVGSTLEPSRPPLRSIDDENTCIHYFHLAAKPWHQLDEAIALNDG